MSKASFSAPEEPRRRPQPSVSQQIATDEVKRLPELPEATDAFAPMQRAIAEAQALRRAELSALMEILDIEAAMKVSPPNKFDG